MQTSDFDYGLPDDLIAQEAIEPRDSSRLLLAATREIVPFRALGEVLRRGDLLVVNRTKVRSARLHGNRVDSGGAVEVLLTKRIDDRRWQAMLRPSRRLRAGIEIAVGDRIVALLSNPEDGLATVSISPDDGVEAFIDKAGEMPLPPYFKGELASDDRYQTMFAETVGSAAAPTAALHFTERLVDELIDAGIEIASVDLEVGIDTFRPMAEGDVSGHRIHSERVQIGEATVDAVDRTRARNGRVIAVGTTVVRSLESAACGHGRIQTYDEPTELFIAPGYQPQVIDGMLTNFHAPRTTLLVMIAAFVGPAWKDLYRYAVEQQMRFLSFGDAMFLEVQR